MADIYYGSGIVINGNLDIAGIGVPADSRVMIKSRAGLQELVEANRVYDGMIVYCESDQTYHKCRVTWKDGSVEQCSWTEVVITSEEGLKTLIASETTAAMEFKGVINNGTLPTSAQKGDMYKIVTTNLTLSAENNAETVSESVTIQPGDSIVYEGDHKWYHIPSGDDIEDTWRPQIWDGVQLNSRATLNVVEGQNIDINANADGTVTINAVDTDTHHQAKLVFTDSEEGVECKTVDSNDSLFLNLVEGPDNAKEVRSAHKIVIEEHSPITITNQTADPDVENSVDTLTIALKANSADSNGYVQATNGEAHKVWATDETGAPAWLSEYEGQTDNPVTVDAETRTIFHNQASDPTANESPAPASVFITGINTDGYGHITDYDTAAVDIPDVTLDEVSISRNEDDAIELKGFADAAPLTLPQKKSDGTGIEWVTVDAVIEGAENTITVGDGTSIDASTAKVEGGDIVLEIKGVREAENKDKLLSTDGAGNVEWVSREDIDTVVTVKDGDGANKGIKVTKATTPETDADVTYEIAHEQAPTTGNAATSVDGIQGTYVTEVLVDEFGHVAGVKTAADKDTIYDITSGDKMAGSLNGGSLVLMEDEEEKRHVYIHGNNGIYVTIANDTNDNPVVTIDAPDIEVDLEENKDYKDAEVKPDTVPALVSLTPELLAEEVAAGGNRWMHHLEATYVNVPTKEYVDRLVSGATSYLGTVANEAQLKALNPEKGDFVRVSEPFNGYHASDMLICETPKAEGVDATWSLIHGEIDTDTNTWELNTRTADGYVKKGEGHANQVWKTDADGNPGWRDDEDTTYTADEASLTLTGTEFSIKDYGVTTAKIDDEAVTTIKIADKAVTNNKLSDEVNASLGKADSAVQYVELIELVDPDIDGSDGDYDTDERIFTTGFTVRVGKDETTYKDTTFELFTAAEDGIIFYPNNYTEGSADEGIIRTGVGLADWAKYRILDSVSSVDTTYANGLKAVTTYTYYNEAAGDYVTTQTQPYTEVNYTKNTTIDIDDSVTFILNCGTAADL